MLFLNSWYIYTPQVWNNVVKFVVQLVVIGDFLHKLYIFCKYSQLRRKIMNDAVG